MHRLLALAVALPLAAAAPGAAQEATPMGSAAPPDAAECRVAPRPIEDFRALLGTPVPPTPETFAAPAGDPADPAVVEGVLATVRELLACHNAGDFQRQAALYTDAGFVEDFRGLAEDDVAAIATPSPGFLPPLRLVTVRDVVVLDDGRVGAVVVTFTSEVERDDYLFLVEQDGRYLVDHFVDEYVPSVAGTPTP
ncbi:MAG: hypothetical protein AVDCRST_MAG59-3405 [uncultured Thermomicrobiales bacterium]|uniref:DUF3828 domain-containing protein n=1 Tax=uncultured Thermomicrobiales bacterium TaxID=1645740 RepID=A0A6J4V8B9_9BACT|nr:MAG: hypothetical protein AVDCRST_MAG59-3405 [uncultured Thermomicrobiales bacterium]